MSVIQKYVVKVRARNEDDARDEANSLVNRGLAGEPEYETKHEFELLASSPEDRWAAFRDICKATACAYWVQYQSDKETCKDRCAWPIVSRLRIRLDSAGVFAGQDGFGWNLLKFIERDDVTEDDFSEWLRQFDATFDIAKED